jgi:hypothetical protein
MSCITHAEIVAACATKLLETPLLAESINAEVQRRISSMQTMTAEDLAARLKVPLRRVYKLPIDRVDMGGRTLRFKLSDVEAYIAKRTVRYK